MSTVFTVILKDFSGIIINFNISFSLLCIIRSMFIINKFLINKYINK